jgi:cell division protein FtsL
MAVPIRARRLPIARTKTHQPARASVRSTRHNRPNRRPNLRVVPRPRVAINAAVLLVGLVVALMLATVVLHTRLAERQLQIDQLEDSVTEARERFDVLRSQRAELRSPNRLEAAAGELGMQQAPPAEFLPVDPYTLADVLAGAGSGDGQAEDESTTADPLDQIRRVKQASDGTP